VNFFYLKDKQKILKGIKYAIAKGLDLEIDIFGSDQLFKTKALKLIRNKKGTYIVTEKLASEKDSSFIQSSGNFLFSFEIGERKCTFSTKYSDINTQLSESGVIIDFPSAIRIEDKRREERIENGLTKFLSAEFHLSGVKKLHQLKAVNLGAHGIGLIVDKDDDILCKIDTGSVINNLQFFLPAATLTTVGIVKHKTLITEGEFNGNYIVGFELEQLIDIEDLENKIEKTNE